MTVYVGERLLDGRPAVFVEQAGRRRRLPHVVYHSPPGLEWADAGPGAADLALSLLAHALGDLARGWSLHHAFKGAVVSSLHPLRWRLSRDEVLDWVAEQLIA